MKAIIKPIKIDSILEDKNFKTLDEKDLYIVTTIFTGFSQLYQVPTVLTANKLWLVIVLTIQIRWW